MIGVIGRRTWRARRAVQVVRSNWKAKAMTVIAHHSADHPPKPTRRAERKWMRNTQAFHMGAQRGWNDIGYNYVIMPSGRVYAGRGFGVVGSHAPGWNTRGIGICFAGDYSRHEPTAKAVKSYHRLVYKLRKRGVNIVGERAHGDVFATSCPGRGVRRALGL